MSRPERSPRVPAPAGLQLIGAGLDAIVQRTLAAITTEEELARHVARVPAVAPVDRLARYAAARKFMPDRQLQLRISIGQGFQRAWTSGQYPRMQKWARVMVALARNARQC